MVKELHNLCQKPLIIIVMTNDILKARTTDKDVQICPCLFLDRSYLYHTSRESPASIHICIVPSRYNLACSNGLSIARTFNAHSELGVVINPSSAFAQSIRRIYPNFLSLIFSLMRVHK